MYVKSSFPLQAKVPDRNCNAYEALWNRREQAGCPDDVILHIDGITGKKRTYHEFRTRAVLAATTLGTHVSENREMVAIISHNSLDHAVLVHSLLLLATPFALLNPFWTPFEFEYAFKLIKPTRLFVQDQLVPIFVSMTERIDIALEKIHVLGQKIEGLTTFEEMVEEARSQAIPPVSPRAATRDTLAYLMFSSGTTGLPKAIMISHGNIVSNFNKSEYRSGYGPNTFGDAQGHKIPVHFLTISMCFSSGLTSYCVYPFITPGTFVIIAQPSVEATLEAISRYKVTIARFQPSFIRRLLNYSHLKDADLSSLQLVLTSGSYFSAELLAKMAVAIPHKFYFAQSKSCLCFHNI
jgi:acyl-CoA synthetase (AMP-forming)/AMP-acid ligase II